MYEKISEMPIRKEKVRKLKKKIFAEIKAWSEETKDYIRNSSPNIDESEWDFLITREFNLSRLKEYIQEPNCFFRYFAKYEDKDIIVYKISDENLNVWLQDDYNFVTNFLLNTEHANVFCFLNDDYFEFKHTSIFDKLLYEKKLNRKENN